MYLLEDVSPNMGMQNRETALTNVKVGLIIFHRCITLSSQIPFSSPSRNEELCILRTSPKPILRKMQNTYNGSLAKTYWNLGSPPTTVQAKRGSRQVYGKIMTQELLEVVNVASAF